MLAGLFSAATAQETRETPYWAALSKSKALMRVGPSTDYPGSWVYQRVNMPVRVIATYPNWRKVEDPDGVQGWMHVRLLKAENTAIVRGTQPVVLHQAPSADSPPRYRVQPGVVGLISKCANGWCAFDADGKRGYVNVRYVWGATDAK